MMCISPISIPRKDGRSNADRIMVPCGHCYTCLRRRQSDWSFRLEQELRRSLIARFITMTYSDDFLPEDGSVDKIVIQLYLKKLRNELSSLVDIKYYMCAEYGERTERPHYHGILFFKPKFTQFILC